MNRPRGCQKSIVIVKYSITPKNTIFTVGLQVSIGSMHDVFTYSRFSFTVNGGKYDSPMDPMGFASGFFPK